MHKEKREIKFPIRETMILIDDIGTKPILEEASG